MPLVLFRVLRRQIPFGRLIVPGRIAGVDADEGGSEIDHRVSVNVLVGDHRTRCTSAPSNLFYSYSIRFAWGAALHYHQWQTRCAAERGADRAARRPYLSNCGRSPSPK